MGVSEACGDDHEACVENWCDCGCHHEVIDAHHEGKHAGAPDWKCQHCRREAAGGDLYLPTILATRPGALDFGAGRDRGQ